MNEAMQTLRKQYKSSLQNYLSEPDETALWHAHVLGRTALTQGLGSLHIAELFQQILLEDLQQMAIAPEAINTVKQYSDFFMENLSVFEMIEYGYLETSAKIQDLDQTLEDNKRFLDNIVAVVPSGLLVFNQSTGKIISTNRSFCEKFRAEPEEICGRPVLEVLDLIGLPAEVKAAILTNQPITGMECECNSLRTGKLSLKITLTCGRLENEEELCLMLEDITDREKIRQEMAHLERMNLIGEMAAGIGHEIRNPMTAVRGFLQLMASKREYARDKEYFALMIEELDRANSIISEFLSLARTKVVELKRQNLNNILESLAPLLQATMMQTDNIISLELNDIPDLLLNEKEIRQLVLNLVRNGREAMSSSTGKELMLRTYVDGEEVILAVQDQGKGIEPQILNKLGTPFLTTKENGTGLGLSICYSISARHKAKITVETGPEGTTFFVHFNPNNFA